MGIAIVTDSTADLPSDLAESLGIRVMPNVIVIDGQSYVDGAQISRNEFYERLPEMKTLPTTATASPGSYEELYEDLLQAGYQGIVSIHPSPLLSGILNAVNSAAQRFGERVRAFDSGMVSMALGFQAIMAAEQAAKGAGLADILNLLENVRRRSRLVAMLDTLEFVRRSGRVSWARARLGDFLRIKPFLEVKEGIVHSLGEVRTRRKGQDRLAQFLIEQGPIERLAVVHTFAEEEARQWLARQNLQLSTDPLIVNVTTVIGAHVGPGALGFCAVTK